MKGKGKVGDEPSRGRGGRGRGRIMRGGALGIQVDRQRRQPIGSHEVPRVPRPCRPSQPGVPPPTRPSQPGVPPPTRPSQPASSSHEEPVIRMIPTPPAVTSTFSSQHYDEHPSHRVHHERPSSHSAHDEEEDFVPDLGADDDDIDPYAEELQQEEELAEEEQLGHADPRGELAQFMHSLPRSQWPKDRNGKYWLRITGRG